MAQKRLLSAVFRRFFCTSPALTSSSSASSSSASLASSASSTASASVAADAAAKVSSGPASQSSFKLRKTKIERLAFTTKKQIGEYVGRRGRRVVFLRDDGVHFAGPDADVMYKITNSGRKFDEAVITSVLSPSPFAEEPKCPHFGECGGCRFQHIVYEKQLEEKERYLLHTFKKVLANQEMLKPIVGCEQDGVYSYRNKMEFGFGGEAGDQLRLGLHKKGDWRTVIDMKGCAIQGREGRKAFETVLQAMRKTTFPPYNKETHEGFLRHCIIREAMGKDDREVMVDIVTKRPRSATEEQEFLATMEDVAKGFDLTVKALYWSINDSKSDTAVTDEKRLLSGEGTITERCRGKSFRISPKSFFQTNTKQSDALFRTVEECIDRAGGSKGGLLLDLYCGAGTVGLILADRFDKVIGVEIVEDAVKDAQYNAKLNGVEHASFHCGDAAALLPSLQETDPAFQMKEIVAIVDPPRAGLEKAIKALIRLPKNCKTIVYVSCGPASLAHDLERIAKRTRYRLREIIPVDMFPHTSHVENVALLTVRGPEEEGRREKEGDESEKATETGELSPHTISISRGE